MTHAPQIEALCSYIRKHSAEPLPLPALAARAGLSQFHFQRAFKAATGVTPRQYVESCRMQALKNHLRTKPVTDAIYEAGYGSCSRVYERTDTHLGMTPAEYGAGGAGAHITYATTRSPLGRMLLAATDRGLCAVQFADTDALLIQQLRREYPAATVRPMSRSSEEFLQWIGALNDHLRGAMPHADLPLDVRATAFQVKVWNYLRQIPRGETQSYAEVAAAIGHPTAARAVARACASNKVAIVIPCHRVIRGTGHLGGYRWGLDRKASLLAAERVE